MATPGAAAATGRASSLFPPSLHLPGAGSLTSAWHREHVPKLLDNGEVGSLRGDTRLGANKDKLSVSGYVVKNVMWSCLTSALGIWADELYFIIAPMTAFLGNTALRS